MPRRYFSLAIVLLMVVSAFAIVIPIASENVAATAPTITVYGISPTNAEIGTYVRCWLTYTDADNDAPTYVRCERSYLPITTGLQPPVNTMVANNSGDTTYTDGKQYYFDWYYFPFINTGFIFFLVKSGADAQVNKFVVEYQEPAPKLKHSGVTPMNNTAGNYTFFTNYTDQMNGIPTYVRIKVDGISHTMTKNNSSQTSWITGVDYSYTENLAVGSHTYSFHCTSQWNNTGEQSTGVFWLIIGAPTLSLWFTSSPSSNATVNETYSYQPTIGNPGNLTLTWTLLTNATGLNVDPNNGTLTGTVALTGLYFVNLSITHGSSVLSQNFSLLVGPSWLPAVGNLVLAIVFGFGLIILSFIDRKRAIWPVFAGFVWLTISVVALYPFGTMWMVIGIGIGLILMLEGSMAYAAGREK